MANTHAIDIFLDAIEHASISDCDAWSADATLDATVPNWRMQLCGADAIRGEYGRWFADPAKFEELHRYRCRRFIAMRFSYVKLLPVGKSEVGFGGRCGGGGRRREQGVV